MIRNNMIKHRLLSNKEITNAVSVHGATIVKATSTYSTKVKFLAKVTVRHLIIATYQRLKSDSLVINQQLTSVIWC